MTRAVIAGFARTPFHFANKGKLVGVRPDDLAAIAIKGKGEKNPDTMLDVYISMGETAENVARQYNVSRADQEKLAYASQMKAAEAQREGRLRDEIVPVKTADGVVDTDGTLRPNTTLEGLAALKPALRPDGSVTAGTSSPLTDGASATLITSEAYAKANGLDILGRIRSVAIAGVPPEIMGMGPVPASLKALQRAGLTIKDIDVIEINEAFGSQAVASIRELAIPMEKVNIDGGGISIGHPLGSTGARITAKAAQIMKREGKRYALATQCIGGGQGIATVIEAA
jgi:acetyl-CoA acyltransferase